jgi:hypothetical protein
MSGAEDMFRTIAVNSTIIQLDMSYTSLEDEGATCLFTGLMVNKTLKELK